MTISPSHRTMTQMTYVSRTWKSGSNKNPRFLVCKTYLWVQHSCSTVWDIPPKNVRATPQWSLWGSSNLSVRGWSLRSERSCALQGQNAGWVSLKVLLWPTYVVPFKPLAVREPQRKKGGFLVSPGYSSLTWPYWPTGSVGVRPGSSGVWGKFWLQQRSTRFWEKVIRQENSPFESSIYLTQCYWSLCIWLLRQVWPDLSKMNLV